MKTWKKWFWVMLVLLVALTGCKPKKETLALVSNSVYSDPKNPTSAQIEAFNDLSQKLESGSEEEIVKAVAVSFAFDFFSFKNKENEKDIGGLSFFDPGKQKETKDYVSFYYYKNYQPIVNQYGADSLPQVAKIVAVDPVATTFIDSNKKELSAYSVRLAISYEDTKIPDKALKTDTVITLVKMDGIWRVVAID